MQCTLERVAFSQALQMLTAIVGTHSIIPIVQNVLIHAADGMVSISSTNMEMYERCCLVAEVGSAGDVTVPAKNLLTLVSNMEGQRITLDAQDNSRCIVKTESTCFSLIGLPPENFPDFPTLAAASDFIVSEKALSTLIGNVFYAVSQDESAPAPWTGVSLKFDGSTVTAAATNSKCLAVSSDYLETPVPDAKTMILPLNVALELKRHLGQHGNVRIQLEEGAAQACFHLDGAEKTAIFAKLLVGVFPDYRQIIPATFGKSVSFPPATLLKSIKLVCMTLRSQNAIVFKLSRKGLTVCGNSVSIGNGTDFVPLEYPYDDEIEFMFSVNMISNPLQHVATQRMQMHFNNSVGHVMLTTEDGFLYLLAPMRPRA